LGKEEMIEVITNHNTIYRADHIHRNNKRCDKPYLIVGDSEFQLGARSFVLYTTYDLDTLEKRDELLDYAIAVWGKKIRHFITMNNITIHHIKRINRFAKA
jgi:hypothetical protein